MFARDPKVERSDFSDSTVTSSFLFQACASANRESREKIAKSFARSVRTATNAISPVTATTGPGAGSRTAFAYVDRDITDYRARKVGGHFRF